ncbi:MAG TPA: tetratricopeptide repeat protein [Myxococcota bacterium]|jgi:tetratricopeptide (TPR) repeat protein
MTIRPRPPAAALLIAALLGAAAALASEADTSVLRANALARQGRCDAALALLAQSGAGTARAALLRGQCHLEGKRWAEAITALDEAQRLDPKLDEARLPLLIARFNVGDIEGARRALDAMPASATQRAEYHLYRGLLLLEGAENAQAAAAFDRARELAPTEMAPAAAYYSGVAWLSAKDRARANAAFDRTIALAPGSEWAKQAEAARRGASAAPLARWAWLRIGAEWDSNVVLRGEGVDLDSGISNQSDARAVWVAHGGAEAFRRGDWAGGVSGTYYGSAHFDLGEFDEHHPTLAPWLDYRIDESTLLRLRYDVGYAWIDGDDFLFENYLTPTLYHDWGAAGRSQFALRVSYLDFLFPTSSPPASQIPPFTRDYRDRDGIGWGATAQHALPVSKRTDLHFGVSYLGYAADGAEYDYNGAELFVGFDSWLPGQVSLRAETGVGWLPFGNPSSYEDPPGSGSYEGDERDDVAYRLRVELERELGAGFSLLARYRYANRASNVAVYDYDRHIVGLYVTYSL